MWYLVKIQEKNEYLQNQEKTVFCLSKFLMQKCRSVKMKTQSYSFIFIFINIIPSIIYERIAYKTYLHISLRFIEINI